MKVTPGSHLQHSSVQVLSSRARAGRGLGRPWGTSAVTQACVCIPESLCEARFLAVYLAVYLPASWARLRAAQCLSGNSPAPAPVHIPFSEDTPYPGPEGGAGILRASWPRAGRRLGKGMPAGQRGRSQPQQVLRGNPTSAGGAGTCGFRGNGKHAVSHPGWFTEPNTWEDGR